MYIIILRYINRPDAGPHLPGHKAWLQRGIEEGLFLLAGSTGPDSGGAILAHGASAAEVREAVNEDPFVRENIVSAEVLEFSPTVASEGFQCLLAQGGGK